MSATNKNKSVSKLSVIIPVYNVEKYLSQCLDSVINQTMSELEIICVNDGSTDDCAKILKKYAKKDSRIKIVTQENAGLSAARNVGLQLATCDYITFLDSDDWVAIDFYETLYNTAIENDADISCGNTICYKNNATMWFDDLSKRIFSENKIIYITPDEKRNVCTSWAVWNKIYKRSLIVENKLNFYDGKLVEDFPFCFLACVLAKKIVVCPFANLYYRHNPEGIMRSKQEKCAFSVLDNCVQLRKDFYRIEQLKNNADYQQILDNFIFNQCMDWADRVPCQQYQSKFKEIVQSCLCYDKKYGTVLGNIVYGCLKNKLLTKMFHYDIRPYKIEFFIFNFIPVLKIKWHESSLWALLFGIIPIYRIYKYK